MQLTVFKEKAKPVAIIKEVTVNEFNDIFEGEGKNEDQTPLENIYPHSDDSCLVRAYRWQ